MATAEKIADKGITADGSIIEPSTPEQLPEPPREGGLRGWLQVLGTLFILFNVWGLAFAFGSFQSYYTLTLLPTSNPSAISWVGTIQSWLLIIGGLVSGPLFDQGHYRVLLIAGSFLSVFGVMMLSLAREYYQILLSQGICAGLGFGLLYIPSITLVSRSFTKKRALALGVSTAGAPLGGVVYTLLFERLLPRIGFAWTVRVMGFLMLGLFIMAGVMLLVPSNDATRTKTPSSSATASPATPRTRSRRLFDIRALKDAPFWSFTLSNFLLYLGYMTPFYYIPIYAETKLGTSRSTGLYILIISQAASIVGRVVTTAIAHYFGAMIPWIVTGVLSGVLCLAWMSAGSLVRFILFAAFYGGISGALIPLPPAVFPHICPDPSALGTWLGMAQSITSFATLIGAPIAGALAHLGSDGSDDLNFLNVQLWCGVLMLAGSVSLGVLDAETRDKKRYYMHVIN
ncbi:major facilitator superfamily domain-containing protein [Aspergillus stella-maris]|uniref:major facilitator superfamily domain-containing protein n=1 Tax=Aspergillus stella-maris TaxID=1810926 RepID=UPI003CCD640B